METVAVEMRPEMMILLTNALRRLTFKDFNEAMRDSSDITDDLRRQIITQYAIDAPKHLVLCSLCDRFAEGEYRAVEIIKKRTPLTPKEK